MSLPKAVVEYQRAHANDNRTPAVVTTIAVCYSAAVVAVGLRLCSRRLIKAQLQGDDWLIGVGLALTTGYTVCTGLSPGYGVGKHYIFVPDPVAFAQNSLAAEILYVAAIMVIKISILLLYCRIFPDRRFHRWVYAMGAFVVAYSVAAFFAFLFQCVPLAAGWDLSVQGTCINIGMAFTVFGAINVITDAAILAMPLPQLWRLNTTTARKLQLVAVFLTGGLVTVISIVRVTYLEKVDMLDPTWTFVDPEIWTQAEVCSAVISACLPTLRPLFTTANHKLNQYGKGSTSRQQLTPPPSYRRILPDCSRVTLETPPQKRECVDPANIRVQTQIEMDVYES